MNWWRNPPCVGTGKSACLCCNQRVLRSGTSPSCRCLDLNRCLVTEAWIQHNCPTSSPVPGPHSPCPRTPPHLLPESSPLPSSNSGGVEISLQTIMEAGFSLCRPVHLHAPAWLAPEEAQMCFSACKSLGSAFAPAKCTISIVLHSVCAFGIFPSILW